MPTEKPNQVLTVDIEDTVEDDVSLCKENECLPPEKRQKKNSGHRTGYIFDWATKYPDIVCVTETIDGGITEYLYCKLCKKHQTLGASGSKAWALEPVTYIREDKV